MEWEVILAYVLTALFGVLALIFGVKYTKVKDIVHAIVDFLKYVATVPDDGVTPDEIKEIKARALAIYAMIKELFAVA